MKRVLAEKLLPGLAIVHQASRFGLWPRVGSSRADLGTAGNFRLQDGRPVESFLGESKLSEDIIETYLKLLWECDSMFVGLQGTLIPPSLGTAAAK